MSDKTALYRHRNADGLLLYVGISLKPFQRLEQHIFTSRWADDITSVSIQYFSTREEAERAERVAIKEEGPIHNVVHIPDRATKVREIQRRKGVRQPFSPSAKYVDSHVFEHVIRGGLHGMKIEDALTYASSSGITTPDRMYRLAERDFHASLERLVAASRIAIAGGHVYAMQYAPQLAA